LTSITGTVTSPTSTLSITNLFNSTAGVMSPQSFEIQITNILYPFSVSQVTGISMLLEDHLGNDISSQSSLTIQATAVAGASISGLGCSKTSSGAV
jgi:hypothetical protein